MGSVRSVDASWLRSSTETFFFCEGSGLSILLSLELNGLKADPILTERGRYPLRFEIDPTLLVDDNLVNMEAAGEMDLSSAML